MEVSKLAMAIVLNELVDSMRSHITRKWVKRREEKGYFSNIIQELKVEDRFGFKEMFSMDIVDFELILGSIFKFIAPKKSLEVINL